MPSSGVTEYACPLAGAPGRVRVTAACPQEVATLALPKGLVEVPLPLADEVGARRAMARTPRCAFCRPVSLAEAIYSSAVRRTNGFTAVASVLSTA